jgi:hypothetical protein
MSAIGVLQLHRVLDGVLQPMLVVVMPEAIEIERTLHDRAGQRAVSISCSLPRGMAKRPAMATARLWALLRPMRPPWIAGTPPVSPRAATCEGEPGPRAAAGGRYGAHLRAPDGHKLSNDPIRTPAIFDLVSQPSLTDAASLCIKVHS